MPLPSSKEKHSRDTQNHRSFYILSFFYSAFLCLLVKEHNSWYDK